ncbi:MAG TPA: acetate--CoA ligase family protein [Burkholderiales bacterium]|nr:acetate--CoA ligase family protein [Burkholderiales bacterium]
MKFFAPATVALVGASGDAAKNTARPQRYLRKHGYAGRIIPINPSRDTVLGERAYKRIADYPGQVDHALIMVEDVERAIEDCGLSAVPVASIYTNGFADAGAEGVARQERLVRRARELGVRLLGPNSMGLIDVPGHLALSINAVLEMDALPAGGISVISQSGTMLGTVLSRGGARGLGFAKLISAGNEADLATGELVELLVDDPHTRVILLFLETIRDAARLARAARAAHAAGKPVVAYKLGRSALGEEMARTHTGALAGADAAIDAYFRDCGILRVDMLESLIEIAPLVQGRTPPDLQRPGRVAVVTTTGGGAASVVDRLGLRGVELASFNDLTMTATSEGYGGTLRRLLESPDCDAVLATVGSSAQFHPELAVKPIIAAGRSAKPIAAFFTPHAEHSLALAAKQGIASFRTPEACADALAAYLAWKKPRERGTDPVSALKQGPSPFSLLESLGIPVARHAVAEPPAYRHDVDYPVAIKRLGVAHKTETGGVVLNVRSWEEFQVAVTRFAGEKVLVQEMEEGLAEAIVGYREDPVVGPLIMVGAGGVLAEIYRDVAIRLAPVSEEEAKKMIEEVKGLSVIRGYRNLPKGDVCGLAKVVSRLSRLGDSITELEINPVIVKSDSVVAVDVLVVPK